MMGELRQRRRWEATHFSYAPPAADAPAGLDPLDDLHTTQKHTHAIAPAHTTAKRIAFCERGVMPKSERRKTDWRRGALSK